MIHEKYKKKYQEASKSLSDAYNSGDKNAFNKAKKNLSNYTSISRALEKVKSK